MHSLDGQHQDVDRKKSIRVTEDRDRKRKYVHDRGRLKNRTTAGTLSLTALFSTFLSGPEVSLKSFNSKRKKVARRYIAPVN